MILVTGASGFIGRVLVRQLLAEGHALRLFDLRTPEWLDVQALAPGRLEFVRGDVTYWPEVRQAMLGVHTVYHLAAQLLLAGDPRRLLAVNAGGTRIVLQEATRAGVQKLVYTSTGMLYPPSHGLPTREDTLPVPSGPYGASKLEAEAVIRSFMAGPVEVAVLRPLFVLGPGRLGVLHLLFSRLLRGRPLYLVGSGNNRFHMIGVEDLARACRAASRPGVRGFMNVGAEQPVSVREQFEALIAFAGTGSTLRPLPKSLVQLGIQTLSRLKLAPIADEQQRVASQDRVLDLTRAGEQLGFHPLQRDVDVLISAYEWYKTVAEARSQGLQGPPGEPSPDWPDGGIFKYAWIDRLL